ncbi:hypothetical protein V7S43_002022 [Phytophthora oleae]|uniref:Fucosyltransferase n=1 Tax=Phytophthora oleae TaxID=2107226 RepID=A0ABD3G4H7_9STRA
MQHVHVLVSALAWVLCHCYLGAVCAGTPVATEVRLDAVNEDPITSVRLMFPADGALETVPIAFRAEIGVNSVENYKRYYGDKLLCVELDGELKTETCSPMIDPNIVLDVLPMGNYRAQAFITDNGKELRYHRSSVSHFSVVSEKVLAAYVGSLKLPEEQSLVEWAVLQEGLQPLEQVNGTISQNDTDTFLVIGVKTALADGFELRQAIRQTWASTNILPLNVKVLFIGCIPKFWNSQEQEHLRRAISLEKQTYNDLLTYELYCEDSFDDLPNKVKEFLRFAAVKFPLTPFVMIADDDIYLRAGRLVEELRKEDSSQQFFYMGQVWDEILGRSQIPLRDTSERYYISEEKYPLHSYPPFAFGPHYLLSMDCVRFIAKNSGRLRGLGSMDDVSVALWLLPIHVHVEHTPSFSNLRLRACENGFLSLADLSPFGIRSIDANIAEQRSLCDGFDRVTWLKQVKNSENEVNIQTYIRDLSTSKYLEVTSIISTRGKDSIELSFFPSVETIKAHTRRVCAEVYTLTAKTNTELCQRIGLELRIQLQKNLDNVESAGIIDRAYLEMWRYNLFVADADTPPLIIAYELSARFASVIYECLFVAIYERHKRPILVMPSKILREHYGDFPDVFVFSVLDADCGSDIKSTCQPAIAAYMDKYLLSDSAQMRSRSTKVMMIVGEPTDTEGLDERVTLLSTVSNLNRKKYAYLPVASTSFSERLDHPPAALLQPMMTSTVTEQRRFCAYLYARCDRPQREYMFDVLNAMEPVDALGICAGSSRLPDLSYAASRFAMSYNDDAVNTFRSYNFVIAFENSGVPGYVTEKLVNPFLAGSIPIYLGNSTTVSELFNPESFIDCGRFEKLRDCALFVMEVHASPELYERMRREPPIRNVTAFHDIFSWHPSVPSRSLADKLAALLDVKS